jgi:hypothetical protein
VLGLAALARKPELEKVSAFVRSFNGLRVETPDFQSVRKKPHKNHMGFHLRRRVP